MSIGVPVFEIIYLWRLHGLHNHLSNLIVAFPVEAFRIVAVLAFLEFFEGEIFRQSHRFIYHLTIYHFLQINVFFSSIYLLFAVCSRQLTQRKRVRRLVLEGRCEFSDKQLAVAN